MLDRKQHARFVVRPHERYNGSLVGDGGFQVSQFQQAPAVNWQVGDAIWTTPPFGHPS